MNTLIKIRTKRLTNAIQQYVDFKHMLTMEHKGFCPSHLSAQYEAIQSNVIAQARKERLSCGIVPGNIIFTSRTPKGKKKVGWVVSPSNFYTKDWELKEGF